MRSLAVILFILVCGRAVAQDDYIVFRTGVGTYRMKNQKLFRNEFLAFTGLPLRVTDDFPPYYTFGFSAAKKISRVLSAGLSFDLMSTAGRLDYKDYSGYALLDQNLQATQYGIFFQRKLNESEEWSFMLTFHASLIHSTLSLKDELAIGTSVQTYKSKLTSNSMGLRPGVMVQKKLQKWVLQANLGYEVQSSDDLKTFDNKYLYSPMSGSTAKADWSGIRLSIGVGFLFIKKELPGTERHF